MPCLCPLRWRRANSSVEPTKVDSERGQHSDDGQVPENVSRTSTQSNETASGRPAGPGAVPAQPAGGAAQPGSDAFLTPVANRTRSLERLKVDTTYREEISIAHTPVGQQADVFKFFCPLCMMFYKTIQEVPCCSQYICDFCLKEYLDGKKVKSDDAFHTPPNTPPTSLDAAQLPPSVPCPVCNTVSDKMRQLRRVDPQEDARSYLDSPKTRDQMLTKSRSFSDSDQERECSPLKIGDSFDDMKRKMMTFEEAGYVQPMEDHPSTPIKGKRPPPS